jgi:hypothetical protein
MLKLFSGAIAALLIIITTATVQAESQPAPQFRKPVAPAAILPPPKFRPHTAPTVSEPVPQRFLVVNKTPYIVKAVYVQKDKSQGTRNLMGPKGRIPPKDQALVLKPQSNRCDSNVGVVVYDPSDNTSSTNWYSDIDICDAGTEIPVEVWDFAYWK